MADYGFNEDVPETAMTAEDFTRLNGLLEKMGSVLTDGKLRARMSDFSGITVPNPEDLFLKALRSGDLAGLSDQDYSVNADIAERAAGFFDGNGMLRLDHDNTAEICWAVCNGLADASAALLVLLTAWAGVNGVFDAVRSDKVIDIADRMKNGSGRTESVFDGSCVFLIDTDDPGREFVRDKTFRNASALFFLSERTSLPLYHGLTLGFDRKRVKTVLCRTKGSPMRVHLVSSLGVLTGRLGRDVSYVITADSAEYDPAVAVFRDNGFDVMRVGS